MPHMEVCPYSYFWWFGYFWGLWVSFVTIDGFSVKVTKNYFKDWCLMNSQSIFLSLTYFLTQWIIGIWPYAWSCSLYKGTTSLCTGLITRLTFLTDFTSLSVLLLFPLLITFIIFIHTFLLYFIYNWCSSLGQPIC